MKRTFTLLIAVALSCAAMAQSWDYLKTECLLNRKDISYYDGKVSVPVYKTQKDQYGFVDKKEIIDYSYRQVSAPVFEEYRFGRRCYNAGCVLISVGAPLSFIGGILLGCSMKADSKGQVYVSDQSAFIAGEVFVCIGAPMVSVSVPLLCFGDHMKREANWHYRMQK